MPKITVNWDQAEEVFGQLLEAMREKRFPYDFAVVPQAGEGIPSTLEPGSLEHSLFLFCSCNYMRGTIKSKTILRTLARFYDNYPELFQPEEFLVGIPRIRAHKLTTVLFENGLGYRAFENGWFWVANAIKLFKFWQSNPAELFKETTSYEELCERIIHPKGKGDLGNPFGFLGYQEKMVSMLTYFLVSIKTVEPFNFPVPVDFHVLRILVSTKILEVPEIPFQGNVLSKELQDKARYVTAEYCRVHGVETEELADALWLLSSSICDRNPGNRSLKGQYQARNTKITPRPVTWTREQIRSFEKNCGRCPLTNHCSLNIPAATYYNWGHMIIRGKRERPPRDSERQWLFT